VIAGSDVTGIDSTRITELFNHGFGPAGQSEDAPLGLQLAAATLHQGTVHTERYGQTADAATALISWSMAKSVVHAMVGLLVTDGLLDLAAPAPVPEWASGPKGEITLQHLLNMNSGLEFVEDYVDGEVSHVIQMLFGDGKADTAGYAAALPLIHQPGEVFNYSSGTTNIVSAICGRAIESGGGGTGPDAVNRFLSERLFQPLGMSSATITCDDAGTFIGSSFVDATARDFLAFGQLYLQDGVWDGAPLLPDGWVAHARTPVVSPVPEGHWYGAHWWLWDHNCDPAPEYAGMKCADLNGFAAQGYEGQFIVVVPDRDLVVVRLGKTPREQQLEVRTWLAEIIRCYPRS